MSFGVSSREGFDEQRVFKYDSYDDSSRSGLAVHGADLLARATLAVSGIFLMAASVWTVLRYASGSSLLIGGLTMAGSLAVLGGAVGLFAIGYFIHALCDRRSTV